MPVTKIWTDGSTSRVCYVYEGGQPVVIELPAKVTSNVGEYLAIIKALESALRLRYKSIQILTDSELTVKQYDRSYKVKKPHLKKLNQELRRLAGQFEELEITWVPREENLAGHELD